MAISDGGFALCEGPRLIKDHNLHPCSPLQGIGPLRSRRHWYAQPICWAVVALVKTDSQTLCSTIMLQSGVRLVLQGFKEGQSLERLPPDTGSSQCASTITAAPCAARGGKAKGGRDQGSGSMAKVHKQSNRAPSEVMQVKPCEVLHAPLGDQGSSVADHKPLA